MLYRSSLYLLISLASALSAVSGSSPSPLLSRRVLHESRSSVPYGWNLRRRADPDAVLPLKISLRQSNLENLDEFLYDISHPESPNYGQHWTPARVAQTFRPSEESVDVVRSWLANDGLDWSRTRFSKDGAHLHLNASVAEAERLFAAEYYVYEHESGEERIACHHGYHLPEHVSAHVELVTPTVHFDGGRANARQALTKRAGASTISGKSRRPGGVSQRIRNSISRFTTETGCLIPSTCFET